MTLRETIARAIYEVSPIVQYPNLDCLGGEVRLTWADLNETEQADRLRAADAILSLPEIAKITEALEPFAACVEQIDAAEDNEEWAKFRLLIGDYRRAAEALSLLKEREG